ncbi:hypothetical protein ACTXT7_012657 [Hymenolepis weldensis]
MAVAKRAGGVAVTVLVCESDITYSRPINAHLVSKLANRIGDAEFLSVTETAPRCCTLLKMGVGKSLSK